MKENERQGLHPEGLTAEQEKLVDLLISTKTIAKVRKRIDLGNGKYRFIEYERETRLMDFSPDKGEYAFKHHLKNPQAPLSPNIINWRNLPPDVLSEIVENLAEVQLKSMPDFCAGIPNAGTKLAEEYGNYTNIRYVNVFGKNEEGIVLNNTKQMKKGLRRMVFIDNALTKGTSFLEAMSLSNFFPPESTELLVGVDREEGGIENLEKRGYAVSSLLKLSKLLDYYLRTDQITQDQFDRSKQYSALSRK